MKGITFFNVQLNNLYAKDVIDNINTYKYTQKIKESRFRKENNFISKVSFS